MKNRITKNVITTLNACLATVCIISFSTSDVNILEAKTIKLQSKETPVVTQCEHILPVVPQEVTESIFIPSLSISAIEESELQYDTDEKEIVNSYCLDTNIGYAQLDRPDGIEAINSYIANLSDIEIMSRIIFGEQGNNSEQSRVMVGLTILNLAKSENCTIQEVAQRTYKADKVHHSFNCIDGELFWSEIPQYAVNSATEAIKVFDRQTYVVDGVECINVTAFKSSKHAEDFGDTWYAWARTIILVNDVTKNFTCFYE